MAIIKNLTFLRKNKLKNLTSFIGKNDFVADFAPFPFDFINHLLPLGLKFCTEGFIATKEDKIEGLLALEKERGNGKKLKITKLFLEENSLDTGKQLIDYVIARYCAKGAYSFYVVCPEKCEEILKLFVETSNFKVSAGEFIYKTDSNQKIIFPQNMPNYFESIRNSQAQEICNLHNLSVKPHLLPIFTKKEGYFKENFSSGNIFGKTSFRYVLRDFEKNIFYGYLTISEVNNSDYVLAYFLNPPFDMYSDDVINFAIRQIAKRSRNWTLYIKVKDYFVNSSKILQHLESHHFELVCKNVILTKNFFVQIRQGEGILNSRILFKDEIRPAFKVNKP